MRRTIIAHCGSTGSEDAAVMGIGNRPVDLITADVRLLPGDGLRAVETISANRNIPVIFITGYADELKDRAPDAIVVQKPIKPDELESAVNEVLRAVRSKEASSGS